MKRIRAAYETKFRRLFEAVHARNIEKGLNWVATRAADLESTERILLPVALSRVHKRMLIRIALFRERRHGFPPNGEIIFWCDAGLGGLARWLRAFGYQAHWRYNIDDDELLREAQKINAFVLTTDSGLMERGVLRDGHLRGLWLPPALDLPEQLAAVFHELKLDRRPSRCMTCGGRLLRVDKAALRHRIPPKTFAWVEDYFVCEDCGKLFWHGTHWRRIGEQLKNLADVGT